MLESVRSIIEKKKDVLKIKVPKHIAITTDGIEKWALKNNISYEDAYNRNFLMIKSTIKLQVKLKVPILSFYILDKNIDRDSDYYQYLLDAIVEMFNDLAKSEFINENKIKISVLGKWYHLPGRVVDSIKKAIQETKDYDSFFCQFLHKL